MKKIPTIFVRDLMTHLVVNEVMPGCEWVFKGEGVPTRKYDGSPVLIRNGQNFKRYELRVHEGRTAPAGFEPCDPVDVVTGKQVGWVPITDRPDDKWFREACSRLEGHPDMRDGTYEACGPHFQHNPEKFNFDVLVRHGIAVLESTGNPQGPTLKRPTFELLRYYLAHHDVEGIVWHHSDGRMAKIKARDFGIRRGH